MKVPNRVLLILGALLCAASGCGESTGPSALGGGNPPPPVGEPPPSSPAPSTSWQIFVASSSGGDQTRLASGVSPVWSPDGNRIAFVRNLDGSAVIDVMNADGTGQRRLAAGSGHTAMPRWSPDGSKIAFMRRSSSYFFGCEWNVSWCYGEISVIDADGSNEVLLARNAFLTGWSPDGNKVAFVSGEGTGGLYVIDSDGRNRTQLTPLERVSGADWSPDGRRIALRAGGALYVMSADGSGLTQILNDESLLVYSVMWSPQGDRIAFSLGLVEGPWEWDIPVNSFTIQVIDPDGANRIPLAADALDPHWSPDGRSLSFHQLYGDAILIVPAEGGQPSVLIQESHYVDEGESWSPKGDKIAYVVLRDG